MPDQLLRIFRAEAHDHLTAMVTELVALGEDPASHSAMDALFRATHTLKGAARSVGREDIEAPCQALESVMSRLVRGELELTPALLDLLQDAVALIARALPGTGDPGAGREVVERLDEAAAQSPGAPPAPAPHPRPAPPPGPPAEDTVRVSTAVLDQLLFRTEELAAARLAAAESARRAGELAEAMASAPQAQPWREAARRLQEDLAAKARGLARTAQGLEEDLRRLRLAPASTVLDLLPLMVRDLAREAGKEVELVLEGTDHLLDRRVLEALKDPLIHLMRNAVDHGIESPGDRVARGKPARGRITLALAPREGGQVEIRLEDDGAGVDLDAVRAAAVRARLVTAQEAGALEDERVLELMFRSGLSTSPVITRVSGRGLGMAIVRERVERLGGSVRLTTRRGRFTAATMLLPARITAFHGLMVREGAEPFLVPLAAVDRAWRLDPGAVVTVDGRQGVLQAGVFLPCARLGTLLGLGSAAPGTEDSPAVAVAVRSGEHPVAVLVDEVLGTREVLVKEFEPPLVRVRHVAAAGVLGTGELVMILRPADLVRAGRLERPAPAPPAETPRRRVVLVVDDSITTRTVEKSILEAAGFEVRVAADGVEALESLGRSPCDLVVADVDMPRLDGFALTQRIRADPATEDLPVVLVTAMESREDRERGVRLGANAYVFKSRFAESNLVEIIRRLI